MVPTDVPHPPSPLSLRLESSLLEVLQMDFEVEELSTPLDSQVIVWKLELPTPAAGVAKTEGAMRIYTTQREFVGLASLVMVSWPTAAACRVTPHQRSSPATGRRDASNASFVVG